MKLIRKVGKTSQTVYVFIQDSSSTTGAGLTGLAFNTASLTAYYVRGLGSATSITLATQTATGAWSSGGFVAVDGTNMPGVYRFDIPDACLASGADSVVIMFKGATNMAQMLLEIDLDAQVDVTFWNGTVVATPATAGIPDVNAKNWNNLTTVDLPLAPTTAGRKLDVSAGGEAGIDWANIGSPTTAQNLSGTSTKALEPTTAGRTLDVTATGEAGIDWANIGSPTTVNNLSGTTVKAVTDAVSANVTQIDSSTPAAQGLSDAFDGTGSVMTLTQLRVAAANANGGIYVTNTTGPGADISSSNSGSAGVKVTGSGTGSGLDCAGGSSGNGILATGSGAGHGIRGLGGATSGSGFAGASSSGGHGMQLTGNGAGSGLLATGGSSGGAGISGTGGTSGSGIIGTGSGSGHGIRGTGGSSGGNGILATSGGATGNGIRAVGNTTGHGISAQGGNTGGNAIDGSSVAGGGVGLNLTGDGTNPGMSIAGGSSATSDLILTHSLSPSVGTVLTTALSSTTVALPGQEAPSNTPTYLQLWSFLYKAWRNLTHQTATTYELYDDAGAVVDQKATTSDDGTTFVRTEIVSGP